MSSIRLTWSEKEVYPGTVGGNYNVEMSSDFFDLQRRPLSLKLCPAGSFDTFGHPTIGLFKVKIVGIGTSDSSDKVTYHFDYASDEDECLLLKLDNFRLVRNEKVGTIPLYEHHEYELAIDFGINPFYLHTRRRDEFGSD